jgi:cytochrome c
MTCKLATVAALAVTTSALIMLTPIGTASAQDATRGQHVFAKCSPCHSVGPDATNKVGPELNGLDGRHSGTAANYNYSDANKNSGVVWGEDTFKTYIKDPRGVIPGTKMTFAGLTNPQEADDLWAYLKQFDADGNIKK